MTAAAYDDLGRLRGAIGRHAEALLSDLQKTEGVTLDAALPMLFQALVHVDAAGTVTRRRTFRDELPTEPPLPRLIEALIQGRLLRAEDAGDRATITLAHEALLLEWPALRDWLDRHRLQLRRIQMLTAALRDADAGVRRNAVRTLGQIGPAAAEAMPALISALRDEHTVFYSDAAKALGQIGPAAAEAMPALISALRDEHASVRRGAAEALKRIGPAAVPALITALQAADWYVRRGAAEALKRIDRQRCRR